MGSASFVPGEGLVGRDRELDVLNRLLDDVVAGRGSALVIRGVAGIGKSALLRELRAEAQRRELAVLTAAGVESESSLPFATLHQLLGPLLAQVDRLPAPHPGTLRSAFGLADGRPDLFAVALAALELVGEAAAARPLVMIVDDLQWLDAASADVMAFMSRRIGGDAVLTVGATRTVALNDPLRRSGLPDIEVGRLDDSDAAALLAARAPELSATTRRRVLAEAAGNPLALVELPKAIGSAMEPGFALNARLEAAFAARIGDLDVRARALLVVLAADVNCDLRRLLAAASAVAGEPVTIHAAQAAIDVGLAELSATTLRFRHPLMRSAIYQQATVLERLAAHDALAEQLADFPDRRLWHLASAALGSDEPLSAELERYAADAQARGAGMSAVAALRRAADLTDHPGRTTALLLRATELASELGARHEAERLLGANDLTRLGPVDRARLANVLEVIRFSHYPDPELRVRELVGIARTAGSDDLAVALLWRAASRCFFQNVSAGTRREVAAALDAVGLPEHDPRVLAILAYTVPELRGDRVLAHLRQPTIDPSDADAMRFLGSAALVMGDFELSSAYLDANAMTCRRHGRLGVLSRLLAAGNWGNVWICQWDKVRAESEEAMALAVETGEAFSVAVAGMNEAAVAVLRGDAEQAVRLIDRAAADPLAAGMRSILVATTQLRGLIALLAGASEDAFRTLARAFDPADLTYHRYMCWWVAPELADAALAAGRVDEARALLAGLPALAAKIRAPMLLVASQYAEAVLSDDDDAYAAAFSAELNSWPFYRARLQLHHGRRLRRTEQAREALRAARDTFDALGAAPWSDLARTELRAAGETSGRRTAYARDLLSAQELQIATLAAQGLTNRQIAERLFLSHRTVASHLYRIYPRLSITSRTELATALRSASLPDPA